MSEPIVIRPGQVWRRKDPRDGGALVTVQSVDEHFVTVRRIRSSRIRMVEFPRNYEFVKNADPGTDTPDGET